MYHRRIIATGGSWARGESIGKEWHDSIITILKSTENAALSKDGMTLPDWLPHARGLLPVIQEHALNTLEEMKGMAAGSDLSFDSILLLTCAYEKRMVVKSRTTEGRPITGMLKGINYPNQTHLGTPYCCIF